MRQQSFLAFETLASLATTNSNFVKTIAGGAMTSIAKLSGEALLLHLITAISTQQQAALAKTPELLTALQQLLADYRQTKEFDFRLIADYIYDGIYITDGIGKTLYVNSAYTRITGIDADEVIGRTVTEIEAAGLYYNAVTPEVLRQKQQVNSMAKSLRNNTAMLITGSPIFDEFGNIKNVIVIDREMTDLMAIKGKLESTQQQMQVAEKAKVKSKLELEHLRKLQFQDTLIGESTVIKYVDQLIQHIAGLDVTVLITGETGVGKEVVANEIYKGSNRQQSPFIKVNCAAIPAALLEAELFGYEKGAFTGAVSSGKLGLFELADKGMLLLDEIGDMPLELQSKLLRFIQHKEITHIGGRTPITLDVRILAATHHDLRELVQQGRFREDLYYRLTVFPINIPPLRQRNEDVVLLSNYFLNIYNAKYAKAVTITPAALELFKAYSWPGNVRELQNVIERLVIVAACNTCVCPNQINRLFNFSLGALNVTPEVSDLKTIVQTVERKAIIDALTRTGSTRKAAKLLNIDQSTIVKKAKKLGITLR